MKISYIAQSFFLLTRGDIRGEKALVIDPRLDNPFNPHAAEALPKLDYVLITHDHPDHGFGHAMELAKRDTAILISWGDMMETTKQQGVRTVEGSRGTWIRVDEHLSVVLTPALHTSDTGQPVGILFEIYEMEKARRIYHTGDTAYIAEFAMIGKVYHPDIVMLPIGGTYTMGPEEAAYGLGELKPKIAIPMHYREGEPGHGFLQQKGQDFEILVGKYAPQTKVVMLKPGETKDF